MDDYKQRLHQLSIELVKLQRHIIATGERVVVVLEGRDAAGKDGTIKRMIRHLSPRDLRVVALPKPSDREQSLWYFQRYAEHLPAAGEMVVFNRSWYNRAGVEPVMGFCSDAEYHRFLSTAPDFEAMLAQSGIQLVKYYLDIGREEQAARLAARRGDPLKQWKISPVDEAALDHWDDYTHHRDVMLDRTHTALSPWTVVDNNCKKRGRIALIQDLLDRLHYNDKTPALLDCDRSIAFRYSAEQADRLSR
ncbi:polyphosphate kinase 2 [Wenzhouxiangella sp. XN79A]|uniref:polyphosphate kinase 2 n=1 Tax=Wenzhouxiangella sp. XN79A TaxID=2724193 RepID=UPI00197EC290